MFKSIKNSNKLYKKAIELIPSGGQTYSKGVTQFSEGIAPKYLKSGKGAYVVDLDNNKYLDYVMGCQPLLLGYADNDVNNALVSQLKKGSTFSLHNELEVDVAKLIETIFSFINELKDTATEKVTSQKLSFSMNDQSAIIDLNGLVSPEIDIVFNFRSTATFVSKFSEVNLKLIDRRAEKYSISSEIDLS